MTRSLTTLLAIESRLAAAIARAERPRKRQAHQPRRHRVEGQIVTQIALPRFLVWHSYLASRKPTKASMMQAAHHLRGMVLLRYAQWAHAHGKPLPTKHEVPAWALHPQPRRHERAAQPVDDTGDDDIKDSTEKEGMDPSELDDPDDAAAAWWDEMGWDDGLTPDAWDAATPEQHAQWQQEALDSVSADLDFQDWIESTVLNDLQVLQLLESYWNGQAAMFAGQETITEMGIAGDFDLTDPYAMDFLRYQAGAMVTNIDEKTRQQLADALWSGWGGEAEEGVGPFGIPQLAKYVQGVMQNWENGLSDMSRSRALLIANTEVARAETFGQYIAMLSSGVQRKIWVVTAGACQICVTQAEEGDVAIRDPFPNGLMAPPGHPRCRCSLSPWIDETKPFNPKDWQYAPDPDQMRRLFQDPSFSAWPRQVANLNDPALQLIPPEKGLPQNFGLLQFSDLPARLQNVLTSQGFDAGAAALADMQQRLADAMAERTAGLAAIQQQQAALKAQGPLPPSEDVMAGFDLEQALSQMTDEDMSESEMAIRSTLQDALAKFNLYLTDTGDAEGE